MSGWSPHDPAVRKANDRHLAFIDGLEPEEAVDLAKTARALAAPEFAVAIPDGKESVARDTTGVHIERFARLTKHRFDRVTPETRHDTSCVCPVCRLGACVACVQCDPSWRGIPTTLPQTAATTNRRIIWCSGSMCVSPRG